MKYLRIITFLLVCAASYGAFAADLFTVDGIKVSSNGANGKQAKDSAMMTGQREAFARLLERIASNKPGTEQASIEADSLTEMVQSIEVNDEKVTATYYSATLSIAFNRAFVDKFLQDRNITFTDKKSAPIVIVPVLLGDDKFSFEGSNPWRSGIAAATSANHVLNIIVLPSLRGVDKAKITQDIGSLDQATKDGLLKIGQSYNADKLILAVAVRDAGNPENITVRMQDLKDPQSEIKETSAIAADLQSGEDTFSRAAKGVIGTLESQWVKGKNEDNSASLSSITLTVPISSLGEWESTHKKLESLGFLKDIMVKSVNVRYALVDVSYKDTLESLAAKMNQNGMTLEKNGEAIILRVR